VVESSRFSARIYSPSATSPGAPHIARQGDNIILAVDPHARTQEYKECVDKRQQ